MTSAPDLPAVRAPRRYADADEALLLTWAADRDPHAFAALVAPLHPMVHRVCLRITRHEQDAQDATQTALAAAWRHLPGFRGECRFSTWMYRIATHAALGHVRRRGTRTRGDAVEDGPGTARSPEQRVTDVEAVRWALDRIPPPFRAAIVLREFAGLSYRDIAAVQGIRVETVKTRIARARHALAELLADH